MTKLEKRMLYLLTKHGGQAKQWELSQATARHKAADRNAALANLEALELVSSARTPSTPKRGGPGGTVYWLTESGRQSVADMIERGELRDPAKELRGRPTKSHS